MRFLLSTFGMHNPYIQGALPAHGAFPISAGSGPNLDLDYTSLLLGEEYAIDEVAYDDICSGRRPFLSDMAKTLEFLRREGILTTQPLKQIAAAEEKEIRRRTDLLLEDPTDWLPAARTQWNAVGTYMQDFQATYAPEGDHLLNTAHFGVYNYLRMRDGTVAAAEVDRLTKVIRSRKRVLKAAEEVDLRETLKPLVAEVLLNELFRTRLQRPLLDWDDAKPFYDKLHLGSWDGTDVETATRAASKKLLDLTIPDLRPRNIENVVKFIRDEKAVASLRKEMLAAVREGAEIDAKWFAKYVNEAVRRDITVRGKIKKLRWLGSTVGALLPGSGPVQELAFSYSEQAVEGFINDGLEGAGMRQHRWYYALQRIAADSAKVSEPPFYRRWISGT